jgi:hypothetical protein
MNVGKKRRHSTKIFTVGDMDPNRFNRLSYLAQISVSPLKALAFNFRFNQVRIPKPERRGYYYTRQHFWFKARQIILCVVMFFS